MLSYDLIVNCLYNGQRRRGTLRQRGSRTGIGPGGHNLELQFFCIENSI